LVIPVSTFIAKICPADEILGSESRPAGQRVFPDRALRIGSSVKARDAGEKKNGSAFKTEYAERRMGGNQFLQ
jgi:hypothetical protein